MRQMMQRFALAVAAKLARVVFDYSFARVIETETQENATQIVARKALAWALSQFNLLLARFPYLHPHVADVARHDIDRLVRTLYEADLMEEGIA